MAKETVTRTFSIGAICSGANEDFATSRRHSSAGIRALLWATSGGRKSLGCSLGSSRESIYPNILTPDSIPQFTIPSLSVQNSLRSLDKETEEEEEDGVESEDGFGSSGTEIESPSSSSLACSKLPSSSSSSGLGLVLSDRRAERSVSDPYTRRRSVLQREVSYPCSYSEAQHCLDPASRAALSLPHLAKVTTPYGFVTLSQSPQMASEEALLCQAGLRRANKDEETVSRPKAPTVQGDCGQAGYDRQVCTLLLQILTGSQHLYNISTAAAELRPRGIFLVWDEESGDEPDPEGGPSRGQRPGGKLEGNTQMLWRKLGAPRVVLTPLTPAQSGPHPLAYISSQTRALIHFLLSEDGTPSKSRSWYRRGLLYLAWRLQSEATRPQMADMVALLQVLLWGPRVDHRRPADAMHNWLTVKRALLVMKLAERGLIQDQSPLDWEDCMCLQYLAFTDPSAVLKVSSQLWINVNMVNAS